MSTYVLKPFSHVRTRKTLMSTHVLAVAIVNDATHLKLFLEEGEDCTGDEASDAAAVDGQHRHLPSSKGSHMAV